MLAFLDQAGFAACFGSLLYITAARALPPVLVNCRLVCNSYANREYLIQP